MRSGPRMAAFSSLVASQDVLYRLLADLARKDTKSFRRTLAQLDRRTRLIIALVSALSSASVVALVRHNAKSAKQEATRARELHRQNSAVKLNDGSQEIFVPSGGSKGGQSRVVIRPTRRVTFEAHRRLFLKSPEKTTMGGEHKTGINRTFMREFGAIWSIIVPHLKSKTSGLLFIHALFLAARTYLSLLVAKLDGRIVRDLIAGHGRQFARGIVLWLLLAIPASYTNAMIKFMQAKISIAFRTRLVRYIHDIYLDAKLGYYKVSNIDGGIEGADQYITADVTRFCDAAAALYSNLGKPSVDFAIFSYQLYQNLGPLALIGIFGNYMATAWVLKRLAPPFGWLTAVEARLEGEYRSGHTKLITNAEEIAFYDGTGLERSILRDTYRRLTRHVANILRIKVSYNMFEDFMLKYSWSAMGYIFASLPVFLPTWAGANSHALVEAKDHEEKPHSASIATARRDFQERSRMREFITNKRLMLSLADAGGRMMYSIKDLAELAGYTSRVYQLLSTLHRVHASAYDRVPGSGPIEPYSLADVRGTVQQGFKGVRFEHTPVVVPGLGKDNSPGELLIKDLDIRINPGDHILISGANGVGKSAIARVIGGLWPVYRGLVSKPMPSDISFVPQRPYLSNGTLRDQIIYPASHADMLDAKRTDDELMEILKKVKLEYLPSREGGWETKKQWKDVFSGGEKQRVMFARILYKKPMFAVIDEGTSAVSADVEGLLYETCKKQGITLITISHRPSLLQYHNAQLKIGLGDHRDEWVLEKTDTEEGRLSVEHEIEELEKQLSQVDAWKARRHEIDALLSGKSQ